MKTCTKKHTYEDSLSCCPDCRKISNLNWYAKNKEKSIKASLERYRNNKENIQEKRRIANLNKTPEQKQKTRTRKNEYRKKKYKEDSCFAINLKLRVRLKRAINKKIDKTDELMGCSIGELRVHLESKFKPGMNWDNYGIGGWEIDHIVPLSSFNLSDVEELKKACHYTNLQPLWAIDNRRKNNKILSCADDKV